jgi:hypothetical protein
LGRPVLKRRRGGEHRASALALESELPQRLPEREGLTRITNRVEAFHGLSKWLMFGGAILADNDPDHDRIAKFNELLANCAIYATTLDLTATANELSREGWNIDRDDLATVTPYIASTRP